MRVARTIELNSSEKSKLTKLSKGRRTSVRLAERSKIILLAVEGKDNQEIGKKLGIINQAISSRDQLKAYFVSFNLKNDFIRFLDF